MRVLKDKNYYTDEEIIVLISSIKDRSNRIFHPGSVFKVYCVCNSYPEIAYMYTDMYLKDMLIEVNPDMYYRAFRHAYKNEEKSYEYTNHKHTKFKSF